MIDLDPKIWKNLVVKCKIKDNGLEGALADYAKLEDDAHDECLKTIAKVTQLANTLKRAKEVAAAAQAVKYLTELISTAEKEKNEVAKQKATAAKLQADADKAKITADKAQLAADKAKAAADKAEADQEKKGGQDDEDDAHAKGGKEDKGFKNLILSMLQKVKTARPDEPYHYLICDAKPFPYVMIAKQINASHRKLLEKASGGSKRFLKPGTVTFDDGHYCFESVKNIPGQAKKVQGFFKNLTGKKYQIMFGTQKDSEDDEAPEGQAAGAEAGEATRGGGRGAAEEQGGAARGGRGAGADAGDAGDAGAAPTGRFSISASVGQGGKNKPEDVKAVQTALNAKGKAGLQVDGKCGPKTIAAIKAFQQALGKFKPDGLIEAGRGTARALAGSVMVGPAPEPPNPVAPPKLPKGTPQISPDNWHKGLKNIQTNIDEVKKAVRGEYASEHPDLLKAIEAALPKLDELIVGLGTELADAIAKANAARDEKVKRAELQRAKKIAAEKIAFVKTHPLIRHVDNNPFGVKTNIGQMTKDLLVHMVQAIGT